MQVLLAKTADSVFTVTSFQESVIASNHRHFKLPSTFEAAIVIMSINVCSKLNDLRSKDTIKLDLPETSFNTPVEVLRQLIRDRLELPSNEVDLIAFGKILKDDKSLAFYGIKGTTTIYVIKKRNVSHITCISAEAIEGSQSKSEGSQSKSEGSQSKPEAVDVTRMAGALKMALRSSEFRAMLTKLNNREDREKLIAFTPGLREDPIVLAILQDPDLLSLCTEDPKNFAEVVQGHPVLAIAAENLAATFHEDNPDSHFNSMLDQPRYGLDDSDDDDDDEGTAPPQPASADVISRMLRQALDNVNSTLQQTRRQQSGQQQPGTSAGSSTVTSAGSSTAASAGSSSMTASAGSSSTAASASSGHPSEPTSRNVADGSRYHEPNPAYLPPRVTAANQNRAPVTVSSGASLITPSMLQAALMNAVNATPTVLPTPSVLPTPASPHQVQAPRTALEPRSVLAPRSVLGSLPASDPRPPIRDWSNELTRLRELGITDESYAIQILEATDGDVEAAVNIILTNQ